MDNGIVLSSTRENTNETMSEIIARLEREKKEAEEEAKRKSRIEIMLMIDTSGSMSGNRIREARRAAKDFVKEFDLNRVFISVISFADRSQYKCKWENDERRLYHAIDDVDVNDVGYCNAETPINNNYKKFTRDCPRVIVVLTDGYWNDQSTEETAADRAKADGIIIYGIGIGDADEAFLSRISSGKGKKVDLSQLSATFKEVASSIATEVVGNSLK